MVTIEPQFCTFETILKVNYILEFNVINLFPPKVAYFAPKLLIIIEFSRSF